MAGWAELTLTYRDVTSVVTMTHAVFRSECKQTSLSQALCPALVGVRTPIVKGQWLFSKVANLEANPNGHNRLRQYDKVPIV